MVFGPHRWAEIDDQTENLFSKQDPASRCILRNGLYPCQGKNIQKEKNQKWEMY